MKLRKKHTDRRGTSAVEFAIVAPVLLGVIFGMIESSRALTALNAVAGAARESARFAAVQEVGESELKTFATNYLQNAEFNTDSVQVELEVSDSAVEGVDNISCTVTMNFSDVSLVGNPFGFTQIRGQASTLSYRDSE